MTGQWRKVDEVFQSTLDCDPAARDEFLREACGQDSALAAEVKSLLASYDKAAILTGACAFDDGMKVLERDPMTGKSIGPYRILRKIGQGGMGTVYLGVRQDEAFHKQVALKLLRGELDSDVFIPRFHNERQILANLDHPNITRILDGGNTEDGRPYFVMEYIEGEPIDVYCDRLRLPIAHRLKLFQQVCAAVSYAHRSLVIHRDIKPGNVLVTTDGIPRLADFGIAKLLNPGSGIAATMTALHPLTPEYASPEQIRNEPVTTATDVYSLGVLLYRLLTGVRPYRNAMSTAAEIERAILFEEPEKPNLAARNASDQKLSRQLTGDLDNIVLMALRKDPARRYSSVEQFSEDIRRHLDGRPVVARADTAGYRAAKFVARHKGAVLSGALMIILLAAGLVTTVWQARVAAAERDRARRETARAERINLFLREILAYSSPSYDSPNVTKNRDAKISEALEQAAQRAEAEFADQPDVLAEVQGTIGSVYVAQGRIEPAEALLRAALDKYRKLYGSSSPRIVTIANALANCLLAKGKHDEAAALFRRNIEIERDAKGRGQLDATGMAFALGGYGGMLDQRGDDSAEPYLREALEYSVQFQGKDRAFVAMLYNNLGHVAYRKGNFKESERLGRAALDEYRRLPPGTYVEMAVTLSNLGAVLVKEGKFREAEPFVREGLDLRRRILGDSHPDTAMGWNRLADLLYNEGDYKGAEQAAQTALDVFRRASANPENNLLFATPLTELGIIRNKIGHAHAAEEALREALKIRTHLLPPESQLVASTQAALGDALLAQKKYAEATPLLEASYRVFKSSAGDDDSRTKLILHSLDLIHQMRPTLVQPSGH